MERKFILLSLFVITSVFVWFIFFNNKPLPLEEVIAQEMPFFEKKEIIHIEKFDRFALVISKANPDDLTNHSVNTEHTVPVIDFFVENNKNGWSFLNSSWEAPRSYTDHLTSFIKFLPLEENRLITFGDINHPEIHNVKIKVGDEYLAANIIEDTYGNKTYFLVHEPENDRLIKGYSEAGNIIFEVN
ncbi:hypothetical protein H1D32_09770 [Anaerobacillus sp. CMMVII]|uniref:hypothetical protein n=1 Tax=Anaerobacillus sp. CMMVII TaxID=2755588 RepID=UPI0021B71EE3|nr:hypothetical protein [Anaerobacillus sp. CMMVII]MCT8138017.1 hypothetical protein [Anaerobacillus sp. CMMVII]